LPPAHNTEQPVNEFLAVAVAAAREAGTMLREAFDQPKAISYKGEVDLVTESDRCAEALILTRLRKHFPDHDVVAEEGSGSLLGSKYCWHVDPLDGTTNFAHGYPCFAASIGLVENGVPLIGVVFNPVANELFTAVRGEGAYLNGKAMRVSTADSLSRSLVATGFPTHQRKKSANMDYYWEFTLRTHGVRRDGSAALDLCSVAAGRFEAFWEFRLNSWDTAAGILLVREAGGKVTDLTGEPYVPGGTFMLATNGLVHDEALSLISTVAERVADDRATKEQP
jgi:myo-inositol-1(or 4)-monophosphatase